MKRIIFNIIFGANLRDHDYQELFTVGSPQLAVIYAHGVKMKYSLIFNLWTLIEKKYLY